MDFDWLKVAAIVEVVTTGGTILLTIAVFWLRHSFVKHKEFTSAVTGSSTAIAAASRAAGEAVDALRVRVEACERRHEGTAKSDDLNKVNVRLAEIDGNVQTVTATVNAMSKSFDKVGDAVDRIEAYLIERKL
jgi:hypothetical protein